MDEIDNLLSRGVEQIFPSREALEKVLRGEKKLKLYQGFDPSMPSLHLGNFVGLMKLRQFQKLGHEVIFLIGDATGMVGDPSGKSEARKSLTREQVTENAKGYREQAGRVLDFSGKNPTKILRNSQWLDKLSFDDFAKLASNFTFQQIIERDMFQKRIKEKKDLFFSEFLYPIMQGYDSVAMDVDLELGGSDQMFNMMTGRDLMHKLNGKEKFVMTTKLLVDAQGEKVGKTTGNALFLDSTPEKFFGGMMAFPDEAIEPGFELLTEESLAGIGERVKKDPLGEKKRLAFSVVKILWGEESAEKAQKSFEDTFQKREPSFEVKVPGKETLVETLASLSSVPSLSEAKRQIKQGSVDVNGKTVIDHLYAPVSGDKIRVGKKVFFQIE